AQAQREAGLALHDRALDRPAPALGLALAAGGRQRVARVPLVVAEGEAQVVPDGAVAGLGDDLDPRAARLVVLGREGVEAEADLPDLRLRRQLPALEAVHADDGAGPGHLLEHLREFLGIVGQRGDVL